MYGGEAEVQQTELASLIKVAENLRIKGLAVPDEQLSSNDSSDVQKNKKSSSGNSSSVESENVPENLNKRSEVGRDGPSPPRKRRRKDSEDEGSGEIHNYEPELISVDEIKVEPDPLKFEDDGNEIQGADDADRSEIVRDDDREEYSVFTEVSKEENEMDSYGDTMEAGPSGLLMVCIKISSFFTLVK